MQYPKWIIFVLALCILSNCQLDDFQIEEPELPSWEQWPLDHNAQITSARLENGDIWVRWTWDPTTLAPGDSLTGYTVFRNGLWRYDFDTDRRSFKDIYINSGSTYEYAIGLKINNEIKGYLYTPPILVP